MANVYVVTNETGSVELSNLSKVAAFLGIKKVTKADIEAGKYPMVSIMDSSELASEPTTEPTVEDTKSFVDNHIEVVMVGDAPKAPVVEPTNDDVADDTEEDTTEEVVEDNSAKEVVKQNALDKISVAIGSVPESNEDLFSALCDLEDSITDEVELTDTQVQLLTRVLTNTLDVTTADGSVAEDVEDTPTKHASKEDSIDPEYPEVGDFKDEKAIKKYIKTLSDKSLEEWCFLEGVTWKHNDHASINRMRMAMAIKAKHFPDTAPKATKKSKSKYADYTTEQLVQMALDNDIEVPDDKGDMRICRMYTIMALRKSGLLE